MSERDGKGEDVREDDNDGKPVCARQPDAKAIRQEEDAACFDRRRGYDGKRDPFED